MEVSRYVFLVYGVALILGVVTFNKLVEAIWAGFEQLPDWALAGNAITFTDVVGTALAIGIVWYLYKREDYRTYVTEVILELKKVTWPGWDETKRGTLVVIVFTVVLSMFLFGSDRLWKYLTDLLLLPPGT